MAQSYDAQGNAFWYDDTKYDAGGNPVKSEFDTWLGTVSGNAPMQGKVKDYLSGLQTNYGLTTDDFNKALQSYGATYSDGGFLNDKNVGWWGEDAMLRAFGTGMDTLNPNAAYKGSWQSMYDRSAEDRQQKDFADRFAANEANQGSDFSDLGDILKGVGLVTGIGGLAGAFGGLGAATGGAAAATPSAGALGSGTFGLDIGLGNMTGSLGSLGVGATGTGAVAAGGGALGSGLAGLGAADLAAAGLGGLAGVTGGIANAVGNVATNTGANNMDWTDFFTNDPGVDASSFGDAWNGGMNTGGSDWATLGQNADGSINTAVMNAGNQGATGILDQAKSLLSQGKNIPTSLIKSLFGTDDATSSSIASMLGKLGAAGLGAYASNQQSNALAEQAAKFAEYGAPYRQQLASLQSDPGSFLSSPRVTSAVDQGTSAMARALSARDGNPVGSGRALQEMQNYATNSLYGQLTNRENQLANFGGLSNFNAAAPSANLASVQQTGNMYNAIGAGINDIFNPQPTYLDLIKAMKGLA